MGGEHRRDETLGQCLDDGGWRNACPAQARQGDIDAALLGVTGALVDRTPSDVVPVLGEVGQVAEIGEGADHADRLVAAQAGEQLLECVVGLLVGMATKGHRQLADLFDQFEGVSAVLVADHVAQDAAQQADILHKGALVLAGALRGLVAGTGGHGSGPWRGAPGR